MEVTGYRGFQEVATFSAHNWWQHKPGDVLGVMKRRHEEYC